MPRKTTKKAAAPVVGKTFVALVVDKSSSIAYGLTDAIINAFNARVQTLQQQAVEKNLEVYLSLITFDDNASVIFENKPVAEVKMLDRSVYRPGGNTAMLDGVGLAIEKFEPFAKVGKNDAFLIEAITDGEENNSRNYHARNGFAGTHILGKYLPEILDQKQTEGNWTFAFQVPQGKANALASKFGVPRDNIVEWEQTVRGVEEGTQMTSGALGSFFNSRSKGLRAVESFYATTDLSKVTKSALKKNLDEITTNFKTFTVDREQTIKEFVEAKTRKPYVIGSAYYQLMKTEKVQPKKRVVIMEKATGKIWGGDEARRMVGIPVGAAATVTPGNHANYDVFPASTSVNRILPRGTKVLLDTTKTKDDAPTWNHTGPSK